jgi:hypothetical protein
MLATFISYISSLLLNENVKIYEIIIFPVLSYRRGTWSLTLKGEHKLRVFENKVLRRIFSAKRDEVIGAWRKLHNEVL